MQMFKTTNILVFKGWLEYKTNMYEVNDYGKCKYSVREVLVGGREKSYM